MDLVRKFKNFKLDNLECGTDVTVSASTGTEYLQMLCRRN